MEKSKKEQFVTEMNRLLKDAQATFVVDYQGLNVEKMNKLRGELRKIGAEFHVVKNRLVKLACKDTDTEAIKDKFAGTCAMVITDDDIIAPAKVLVELSKEFEKLDIKVGQISGKAMDAQAVKKLAGLPGRDQLLAQALSTMQAVTTSFVRVLNGIILNLLYALKAIEAEKGNG
ncbi:MAG: 50S ribosomal protein L10 [Deltaproteobacteria bacterium]|nr:50S ribosomal protein L10 [Deltaproteobacteria bacterium]